MDAEEENADADSETDDEPPRTTGTSPFQIMTYLTNTSLTYFFSDFRCLYCKKDFHRRQNLYNHINKTKCGKPPHIKGTNANYWEQDKRPFKCTQQGCNGTYSTDRSLWMHLANRHGLQKSNPEIKRHGTKGAVCKVRNTLAPSKKVATKGNQRTSCLLH